MSLPQATELPVTDRPLALPLALACELGCIVLPHGYLQCLHKQLFNLVSLPLVQSAHWGLPHLASLALHLHLLRTLIQK